MKIILSNYRYFISGGPERYLFSIKNLFEKNGVEVYPFSIKSKNNILNKWEDYFLSPLTNDDSVYFHEYNKNLKSIIKVVERSFYSPEGFIKARRYARATEGDIVYLLHFLNKMSPSIIDGFKSNGIPVVARLSDFNIICPQGHLLLNGMICEDCTQGRLLNCFWNRCIMGSYTGSLIKAVSWAFHRMIRVYDRIDAFICPSAFTRKKMIKSGFKPEKLFHISTPTAMLQVQPKFEKGNYILYFGRIAGEKGIDLLINSYGQLPSNKPELLIIADLENHKAWVQKIKKKYNKIHFVPFQPIEKLSRYISNALFVVVPSIWYENMPNTVLEAFAHGKPVIGSNIGSLQELIADGKTGLLFDPGNIEDLKQKLFTMYGADIDLETMGRKARRYVEIHHSEDGHYHKLMSVFKNLIV